MCKNLALLAHMLILLWQYQAMYSMLEMGGLQVQKDVLADITHELYQSRAPMWGS